MGSIVAYLVQDGGSDWRLGKVMNIETGEVLDGQPRMAEIHQPRSWAADGSGFYYSRYPGNVTAEDKFQSLNTDMSDLLSPGRDVAGRRSDCVCSGRTIRNGAHVRR